jgi:etoposide-induced protein 2.4 (EI24)
MLSVVRAFARALNDAVRGRMIAIVLLPALAALLLWSLLGWMYWDVWTGWVGDLIAATPLARWTATSSGWHWVVASTSAVLVIAFIIPAVFITALVITELVAMPVIVAFVARHYYPVLEEKAGGTW